ncbi:MAG TPA: hypothetical protein VG056_02670 [Pirellulales bacterium]|jgi:hypothetical protein|nr:hypothetical protein [Pirellulales bacterium]
MGLIEYFGPVVRRFLVASGLGLWLGGFTFYGAVVIKVGEAVLGSHRPVGFITQEVSHWLNLIGAVAVALLLWNIAAEWAAVGPWRRFGLAATWIIMVAGLAALVVIHRFLDGVLEVETQEILNYKQFIWLHRFYLAISTIQWAAGLLHAWLLLLPSSPALEKVAISGPHL